MGKPQGSDLRKGKRTALVVEAVQDRHAREALDRVLGCAECSSDDLRVAVEALETCGARRRVEARIEALVGVAREALGPADLTTRGRQWLDDAARAMTERHH
jgi:geranylgeranyl pyrophosphate synthase